MSRITSQVKSQLICGIPQSFWEDPGRPNLTLVLGEGLGPASTPLIRHLCGISSRLANLEETPLAAEMTRKRLASAHLDKHLLVIASDSQNLPLPETRVDLAVSYWSLHHHSDPLRLMKEVHRVLNPGGHVILVDGIDLAGSPAQELHRELHHLCISIDLALKRRHIPLLSPSEMIEILYRSGFQDVKAEKILDTSGVMDREAMEAFRLEAVRLLSRIYPPEIEAIRGGKERWGDRLKELAEKLKSLPLELHPYMVVTGRKAPSVEKSGGLTDAKSRSAAVEVGEGYLLRSPDDDAGYPLRFRDLPDEFKPREKLIMHGPAALKNHELLAVMLVSGTTRENVMELSRRLIQQYGSRAIAQERSVRRLKETLGLGTNKACQIVAAFELGRRFFEEPMKMSPTILAAEDAYEYLRDMSKFTKEHFRGLYLNTRGRVIRDEIISIGTLNMSVVHPREVFLPAVEFSAAAIILAHNHPSGDPTPSDEDPAITHQMVEAGRVMGIEIFDHLIIGDDSYVSLQKEGKLI